MSLRMGNVSQLQETLRTLPDAVRKVVVDEIQHTGNRIRQDAKARAPVQEGELRESIKRRRREKGLEAVVGSKLFYAKFIEFGTKQHVIRNKKGRGKKVLYSGWAGSIATRGASGGFGPVSGKVVHPGNPPRPFLHPAAEEHRRDFPKRLAAVINTALKKTGGQRGRR